MSSKYSTKNGRFSRHTNGNRPYTLGTYMQYYNELAVLIVSFLSTALRYFLPGHVTVYTSFVV